MSEVQPESSEPELPWSRSWLAWPRHLLNVLVPLLLAYLLILAALPHGWLGERSELLQAQHDKLVDVIHKVSLSQTWSMYAPDPGRGNFYMELVAYDDDGGARKLEDSYMAEHGWGTAVAWERSRLDIWQHAVTRHIEKANRNRTWYLRGVCLREARRGYDVRRVEMQQVFRRIRSPQQVREGKKLLGPPKRRKAQDGSCNVRIIREMIEEDPVLNGRIQAQEAPRG